MAIPMALLKKGMEKMRAGKGKSKEEKGESKAFEAGEKEGKKEYIPFKGKK